MQLLAKIYNCVKLVKKVNESEMMTRFIFILKADEVSIQESNNIKKTYRKENKEVQCYYQSVELFDTDLESENTKDTILCISFQHRYFIKMTQWIEKIRGIGFQGTILLSTDPLTFDLSCAPKYFASGGNYILERSEWKHNPLLLMANKHASYVENWIYNKKNFQDVEVVNEEALSYLFDNILEKERLPLVDLAYIYDALNKRNRNEFLALIKKKMKTKGRSLLQHSKIDFSGEGLITIWDNPEFTCELGTFLADHTDKKILLVDLDRLNPTFDFYRPPKGRKDKITSKNLEGIQQLYHGENNSGDAYDNLCKSVESKGNLRILYGCNDLKKFEYYTNEALTCALAYYKRRYDLVIVNVNDFVYDAYTCLAAIESDLLLLPIRSDIPSIRHTQRTLDFLHNKQELSKEKVHYLFYDCKENFSNEMTLLTELLNGPLVGRIGQCNKRNHYRNVKKTYCTVMSKNIKMDYRNLMTRLNL